MNVDLGGVTSKDMDLVGHDEGDITRYIKVMIFLFLKTNMPIL